MQYSEGINVGYRYYDANNETPLFPFGYGLSYTNFRFSGLSITPRSLQNATSNPGTTACGCNGQSSQLVTVSATVTNTGQVAGSDVAQLYLDDPAAAGEPPRQLKGFQKVTLQPGQSTTVHFSLTGHDLSYWNDSANGWVVPDGQFGVYVGDSSALANLPLRGGFTVVRSVGARYATIQAPDVMPPGGTATVTASLVNDGDYAMQQARFTLNAPAGWTVTSPAPVTIEPGQTVTEHFQVTVPASAEPGDQHSDGLGHAAGRPAGGRTGQVEASATVAVPYASLAAAYNNTGISDNSNEAAANYDGVGDSFSAQALAAGTPTALTPGQQVTIGGTTFTWPAAASGTPDNVVTAGQTVELSGSGTDLGFLGASQNGTASGTVTVHYTDGSSQSYNLNMADWYSNSPAVGNQLLTTTSSWNVPQARPAPGERLLRLGAAAAGQAGGVGHAAHPQQRGGHHRHAHLRHGHGNRNPDDRRAVLIARCGLRQRRDQRQLQPRRGRLRRHRRQLLRAGAGRGHAHPAHARRPGHLRRDHLHLAQRRRRARQRDRRRADDRPVRVRDRSRLPRRPARSGRRAGPAPSPTPTAAPSSSASPWPTGTTTRRSPATRSPPPRPAGTSRAARKSRTR